MSAVTIAVALLIASIILLSIYGADVLAASMNESELSDTEEKGFLPFDDSVRGSVFGGGPVLMSVVAFVISRNHPSSLVSALLFVNGGLIIAGMLIILMQGTTEGTNMTTTVGSTAGLGALLIGLGIWKVIKDRRISSTPKKTA